MPKLRYFIFDSWKKIILKRVVVDEVLRLIRTEKRGIEIPSKFVVMTSAISLKDRKNVKRGDKMLRTKIKPDSEKQELPGKELPPTCPFNRQPASKQKPKIATQIEKQFLIPDIKTQYFGTSHNVEQHGDFSQKLTGKRNESKIVLEKKKLRNFDRLKKTQKETITLTTYNEIDMSSIVAFRKAHQQDFKAKYGIKIGFMSLFLKAAAYAIQDVPVVNASIKGDHVIFRNYTDISVVISIPTGYIVPVLKDVNQLSFADIEKRISDFREKGRRGELTVKDMDGGTFTICNGGVFGSLMGQNIINSPQSAVLGMHAVSERPVAIEGQIVIRPMMYINLTYDNRIIESHEAALFLQVVKKSVENPQVMLAGM